MKVKWLIVPYNFALVIFNAYIFHEVASLLMNFCCIWKCSFWLPAGPQITTWAASTLNHIPTTSNLTEWQMQASCILSRSILNSWTRCVHEGSNWLWVPLVPLHCYAKVEKRLNPACLPSQLDGLRNMVDNKIRANWLRNIWPNAELVYPRFDVFLLRTCRSWNGLWF